jgi:hypothetical protein
VAHRLQVRRCRAGPRANPGLTISNTNDGKNTRRRARLLTRREDVTTECGGELQSISETRSTSGSFRLTRQSSIGLFFDRPGRREAAYRHGCCLMQNKINDLNLLYD